MSLNTEATEFRNREAQKQNDPVGARTQKQLKVDLAGDKYTVLRTTAQRIARELGQHGPITIDDVTYKMAEHHNVMPEKLNKGKEQRWKGAVFSKTEWVVVHSRPSTLKTSHARTVKVWALRTWLAANTMNGKSSNQSAYVLSRIYSDFQRNMAGVLPDRCVWEIGEKAVSAEVRQSIADEQGKLYGIKVTYIPNSIGALLKG